MRILQVFSRYNYAGGEETAVGLLGKMLRRRHEVQDLIFVNPPAGAMTLPKMLRTAFRFFHNQDSCEAYRQRQKEFRPDLVIIHNLFPEGSASLLLEITKGPIPCIFYIHNFRPFSINGYCWAKGKLEPAGLRLNYLPEILAGSWQDSRMRTLVFGLVLYSLHWRGAFRRIDAWVGISEFMTRTFVEAGVPAARVTTLSYPSTMQLPHGLKTGGANEAPEAPPLFLFLGRMCVEKGVLVLLEAWQIYRQSGGDGTLVLAGSGPLAEQSVPPWEGMEGVRYAGQVSGSEKELLLHECRAMVVPSVWWEPYGLVVDDARLYGKPVLAARSGGLAETVNHGVNGWLHEPGDARELSAQFREASASPEKCMAFGRAGYETATRKTAKEWLDQFDGIALPLLGKRVQ